MLTRFKVSGFKNLVDVDIRFGPFTCIAGANGAGKSNLFDAILFLSALADKPFIDSAMSVRDQEGKATDIRSLFHRTGDITDNKISLEAEMIVPEKGVDDLGQEATASTTFLKYSIELTYNEYKNLGSQGSIELLKEELSHIKLGDAPKHLLFPHSPAWRKSVIKGKRVVPLISTKGIGPDAIIKIHQDRGKEGGGGRSRQVLAKNLPRTVLSTANAAENRTSLMAKREMQSWRLLLLEPSALRKPDRFNAPTKLGADGGHLPATLYRLAKTSESFGSENHNVGDGAGFGDGTGYGGGSGSGAGFGDGTGYGGGSEVEAQVYTRLTNRLFELIDDIYEVKVDRDEKRELLTLELRDRNGTSYAASELSDGTLRFLATSVLELDPETQGLICLEEPENGIHPGRIPSMIKLLQDIATDADEPGGSDNPLRQVIVNTHSPAVVAQVPDDSLLIAELRETIRDNHRFKIVRFNCLADTWRAKRQAGIEVVNKGTLLSYLNPVASSDETYTNNLSKKKKPTRVHRVIDRPDVQALLPFPEKQND